MALAIAVPSILAAMVAELQNVRFEAAAKGFKKADFWDEVVKVDKTEPLTPRAEDMVWYEDKHREVRR